MTDDLHLDGNGIAGLLAQMIAVEATTIERTCQSCGDRRMVGEHRAYRGAGVVLRCPSCGDVAARVALLGESVRVEWRGTYEIAAAT